MIQYFIDRKELTCKSIMDGYATVIASTITLEFIRPTSTILFTNPVTPVEHEDVADQQFKTTDVTISILAGILVTWIVVFLLNLGIKRYRRRARQEAEAARNGVDLSGGENVDGSSDARDRVDGGGDVEPPPPYGADSEVLLVGPDIEPLPYYEEEGGREGRNEDGREVHSQSAGDNDSDPMPPPNAHLAPDH